MEKDYWIRLWYEMGTAKLENNSNKSWTITCWQFFSTKLKVRMPAMLETYIVIAGKMQLYRKSCMKI